MTLRSEVRSHATISACSVLFKNALVTSVKKFSDKLNNASEGGT